MAPVGGSSRNRRPERRPLNFPARRGCTNCTRTSDDIRRRNRLIFLSRRFLSGPPAIRAMASKKNGRMMGPVTPRSSQTSSSMFRARLDNCRGRVCGLRMATIACSTARQSPDEMCVNTLHRCPCVRSSATNAKATSPTAAVADLADGESMRPRKKIYLICMLCSSRHLGKRSFEKVAPVGGGGR